MLGTLINAGAIILGSTIGLVFRKNIPQKYIQITFQAIGLFTLFVGVAMAYKTGNYLILVISIVLGGLIGTWFKLDYWIETASLKAKKKSIIRTVSLLKGWFLPFYCIAWVQ